MQRVERLTNYENFKPENINFGVTRFGNVPGKDVSYEMVPITIEHNESGDYGSLLIKTEKCFTFGAQQNLDKETGELTGWSLPIAMYDRLEPTEEQRKWVGKFNEIVECCKDFLVDHYDFDRKQLTNFGNCMWWAKDDATRGPTLYSKIITGKKSKRFDTKFRMVKDLKNNTDEGVPITKEELVDNYNVIAVMMIDSIYVCGKNASLRVKVYEAMVEEPKELPSFLRPVSIKAHTQQPILFKD